MNELIENAIKESNDDHTNKIVKMAELESVLLLVKRECDILQVFNMNVIEIIIKNIVFGDPAIDVTLQVERFAEGVPAMELFEKSFGEVKHDRDWEWDKARVFKFKNAPVRLILVAGDGCQKIKITETHTTEKLVCA